MLLTFTRRWLFLATLACALFGTLIALHHGVDGSLVVTVSGGMGLLMALSAERLIPLRMASAQPGERRADMIYFVLTVLTDALIVFGLTRFEHLHGQAMFTALPLLFAVPVALLLWEFVAYWAHRAGHQLELLWRFHAVHHAPGRMTVLNNFRIHPFDFLLKSSAMATVLFIGFSPETIVLLSVIRGIAVGFQHADAGFQHGLMNYVFSTNELHQWHHSADKKEANANYGTVLSVWDWIFGTAHLPDHQTHPEQMGLFDTERYPTHRVLRAFVAPFCWRRCTTYSCC